MATTYLSIGTGTGGVGSSTTNIRATINLTGANPGEAINFELFNGNSPASEQAINLSSGANTINATTCPALATAGLLIIIPPATNTNTITLKGVSGDTGVALSKTAPSFLSLDTTPPSSLVLTTGGAITGVKLVFL